MSRNQRLIVLIGIVISAVFLWVAFSGLNPAAVWEHIQTADVRLLLFGALWYFTGIFMMAVRWQYLMRGVKAVPLSELFALVCIGYMGNNVYPLRSGEILRVVLLQRNERIPVVLSTTVIVIERIFDGIVMLTFIVVPLSLTNITSPEVRSLATISAPIFIIALGVFFLLAAKPSLLRLVVKLIQRILPGKLGDLVGRLGEDVIAGLEVLRTPVNLAGAVMTSYLAWGLKASVYWLLFFAFGMNLDFAVALVVVGVVNLAGLIPASPGQIGVFEFFTIAVLTSAGIGEAQATGYALSIHLVIWLPVTLLGFYYLARQGLGLSAVARARELEQESVP